MYNTEVSSHIAVIHTMNKTWNINSFKTLQLYPANFWHSKSDERGGQQDKLWKKFVTLSSKNLSFYNGKHENVWIFGGVNKHLFRKVNWIITAQFLLCRLHNSDNLKLYESFRRQTLIYYSFVSESWSSNACKIWSSNYFQICLF